MRQTSAAVQTILESGNINFFYMVKIGTVIYNVTANRDMTFNGDLYSGSNKLMSVSAPRLSSVVDRETYKLTFADPAFEWRPLFEEGFVGETMSVYLGFYNNTAGTLGGVAPGQPMLSPTDVITAYEGTVDTTAYAIDMNENVIASIEGSSPMGALGAVKTFYTSKENLFEINPADTAFNQIFEGSSAITLMWGKI
jgi:uncharacterized protein YdbL (DUF1318 family)